MRKSLVAYFVCCLFLFGSSFLVKKWNHPGSQAAISWDGFGYYFYLPSFFYDEINVIHNYEYIEKNYSPTSGTGLNVKKHPNGNYIMRYPMGNSIMYLPAFLFAHCWSKAGGYKVDGFTFPYQFCIAQWSILFSLLGLWVLRKVLVKYFTDWAVTVSLLILCFATNFFNFVSFSGILTHSYLFTLYAFIIYFTDSFYTTEKRYWKAAAIGAFCGLATITRPTDIISVLIPLLWGVSDTTALRKRVHYFISDLKASMLFVVFAILFASPQLLYWKYFTGQWLYYSYEDDQTFSFLQPHIVNFLFSYKKGWFTYTPVMYLSIVGLLVLFFKNKRFFWIVACFTAINLYLISSWDCWWYGGSFSQRAVIQSYALLMFPLTQLMELVSGKLKIAIPVFVFILFCVWLNLLMTWQANSKTAFMESDNMTKAYFWRIFGKTSIEREDKKLLDTDEELPIEMESSLRPLAQINFESSLENDSTLMYEGKKSLHLNEMNQGFVSKPIDITDRKGGWYRAKVTFYYPDMEWDIWNSTQFSITLIDNTKEVKTKFVRLHRNYEPNKWLHIWVDIKSPNDTKTSELKVKLWNAESKKSIYIDKVEILYTGIN